MSATDQPPSSLFGKLKAKLLTILPMPRATSREDVLESLRKAEEDGIVARDAYAMLQRVMFAVSYTHLTLPTIDSV